MDGQLPREPDNLDTPPGDSSSIISLTGLIDLLTALEPKLSELPEPLPLFARELTDGIAAAIEVPE